MRKPNSGALIDLAVVGGGLAGLSCAVRARFIKSHGSYPMKTVIFEASPEIGGLAALANIRVTGPGFGISGKELVSKLAADVKRYDIPVINSRIVKIGYSGASGRLVLTGAGGEVYKARTAAVCTGMRPLANDRDYFGKGVKITFMGYDNVCGTIGDCIDKNDENGFLIYGNRFTANLVNFALSALSKKYGPGRRRYFPVFLVNDREKDFFRANPALPHGELFRFGRILKYHGGVALAAVDILNEGKISRLKLRSLLLDYTSFELSPDFSIIMPGKKGPGAKDGFLKIDLQMRTALPGIFAAGDVTGPYFCAARAISSGITAAFSAYKAVMAQKGMPDPGLFAYQASNRRFDASYREVPVLKPARGTMTLSENSKIERFFKARFAGIGRPDLKRLLNVTNRDKILGRSDYAEISGILKVSLEEVMVLFTDMILEKLATIA